MYWPAFLRAKYVRAEAGGEEGALNKLLDQGFDGMLCAT
jgi:hypothetical protein